MKAERPKTKLRPLPTSRCASSECALGTFRTNPRGRPLIAVRADDGHHQHCLKNPSQYSSSLSRLPQPREKDRGLPRLAKIARYPLTARSQNSTLGEKFTAEHKLTHRQAASWCHNSLSLSVGTIPCATHLTTRTPWLKLIMIRTIPSHPLTRQTTCPHQLRVHRPDVSVAFVHALRQIHIQRSLFEDGGRTGPLQCVSSVARVFQERARKVFESSS